MAFRNYKVEFEFNGTDYPGISVEEGIDIKVALSSIDGFPAFTIFENTATDFPRINPDGIASVSKSTTAKSGYFVLNFVP